MIIDYDPKLDRIRQQNQSDGKDTAIIDAIVNLYNMVNGHLDDTNIAAKSLSGFNIKSGEDWHEVGSVGEPAFANSWVNYGGTNSTAAFMKDSMGFVHIKGTVKNGTEGESVFTLPVGYRPDTSQIFPAFSNNAVSWISIASTGTVSSVGGNNASRSLCGITFKAEQ